MKKLPRQPQNVELDCCKTTIKVTQRHSKLKDRPRFHRCPQCQRQYKVRNQFDIVPA